MHMSQNITHTATTSSNVATIPDEIRHIKMIESHIKYSDKPSWRCQAPCAPRSPRDGKILYGMDDETSRTPERQHLINSITPSSTTSAWPPLHDYENTASQHDLLLVMSGSPVP
jgi:trimethylamine:corrinoid methyltransferase-like protein